MIITLLGSTKFKDAFEKEIRKLTLEGHVVLHPEIYSHSEGISIDKKTEKILKDLHKEKIDMSDSVLVINVNGYVGENTLSEINYAKEKGKPVSYLVI